MAIIKLRNSLAPEGKIVYVTTALQPVVDSIDEHGDEKWVLVVGTAEPDLNGDPIDDVIIDAASGQETIDSALSAALKTIAAQIDWSSLDSDVSAPVLTYQTHTHGQTNVSIGKNVRFVLEDYLPSSGIDRDTIKLTVNGVEVTNDLSIFGDPRRYEIMWNPLRLLS